MPVALKDNQVFNTASAFQEAQGKIPSIPRGLESDREQQPGLVGKQLAQKKGDVSSKIDKLLRTIEDNLDRQPDNNIVEESVTRSMFGIFARNFKMFKEQQSATDIDVILRKFFKSSQILDDVSSKR